MGDSCTWWPRRRGGRKSCWQPSWSGSYWCRPPESWARCGSWSAGRCWHPRLERWTALASCSPSASVWDWGNGTLQRKDTFFTLALKKSLCGTLNDLISSITTTLACIQLAMNNWSVNQTNLTQWVVQQNAKHILFNNIDLKVRPNNSIVVYIYIYIYIYMFLFCILQINSWNKSEEFNVLCIHLY